MLDSDFKDGGIFGSSFWNEKPGDPGALASVNNAAPNPDQEFIDWLQSKFPKGTPLVYQGNQYTGTGNVESTSSVAKSEPVTLENAANSGSGTSDKSETKEESTLVKSETSPESPEEKSSTSDDYGWVTHLNEEDDKTKKTETKTEAAKEEISKYPNDMSQEEFNAMYEYALGMTGKGGNQVIDVFGEPTGYWGGFETIPLTIKETQKKIQDLQAKYDTLKKRGTLSETVANNIQAGIEKNKAMVKQSQEQFDTLNSFIDNYKNIYSPIEKEEKESKESKAFKEAESKYYETADALNNARANLTKFAIEKGIDIDGEFTESSFYKGYRELGGLETEAGTATLGKGENVNIKNGTTGAITKVTHNNDDSWNVVTSNGYKFTGKGDGTDNIASGLGLLTEDTAHSPDTVYGGAIATIGGGGAHNYFVESYSGKGYFDLLADVRNTEKAAQTAEDAMNTAMSKMSDATHTAATTSKQDIMDRYQRGELNPYQAAVALSNIKDSKINFGVDSITSKIDYNNFKDATKIPGDTGRGTIGIDSLISDLSPVGRDNPASESNISKEITSEFKSLNEIASKVDSIDINGDANVAQKELSEQITNLSTVGKSTFETMVRDLLAEGGTLQDIRENKNLKQFSSDIFSIAQRIYDKTSAIEERTNSYGLGNLDEKSIKQNLGTITDKINELTGSSGVTLDKNQVKALAEYTKSIQCTKDAAIALMKSAAFNGAVNTTGDKYSEAWKKEMAVQTVDNTKTMTKEQFLDKNTLKWTDYLAAAAKGTLGTMVALLGGAVTAINPALGIILMGAGSSAVGKAGLEISTKVSRSKATNEEVMFGTNESGAVNVMNDIYNRSLEPANFGDTKSVGTYTNGMAGALEVIAGFMGFVENPASAVAAIKDGIDSIKAAGSGGLSENTDNVIRNVYELGENIITWSNLNININDYMRTPDPNLTNKGRDVNVALPSNNTSINPNYATYGEATSDNASALDNKYSGYVEQAKNANLAKDYNAGMEENVNEAVSDKYVKVFKVMLDKEPDYIRKVLIAIPKNHCEREW